MTILTLISNEQSAVQKLFTVSVCEEITVRASCISSKFATYDIEQYIVKCKLVDVYKKVIETHLDYNFESVYIKNSSFPTLKSRINDVSRFFQETI